MSFGDLRKELRETLLSLAPAIFLIILFQVTVIRLPIREFFSVLLGLALTIIGFVLFIQGAKLGLLPLGQGIGKAFIEQRAFRMILLFGFLLGIVLTVAEPGVRLLVLQLQEAVSEPVSTTALITVGALGLGLFLLLALLRIVFDTPMQYYLWPGYLAALAAALFSSETALTQAFDMASATTGPVTVPFLVSLGVGMASVLGNRDPLKTGFGLMAIASIGPILMILLWHLIQGVGR
jgi:hypothetical protein